MLQRSGTHIIDLIESCQYPREMVHAMQHSLVMPLEYGEAGRWSE